MPIDTITIPASKGTIEATVERFGRYSLLTATITAVAGNVATFKFPKSDLFISKVISLIFDNRCPTPITQDATLSLKSEGGIEIGDLDVDSPVTLPFADSQTFYWAMSLGRPVLAGARFSFTNFTSGKKIRLFAVLETQHVR